MSRSVDDRRPETEVERCFGVPASSIPAEC
jgi:hypothetical protein